MAVSRQCKSICRPFERQRLQPGIFRLPARNPFTSWSASVLIKKSQHRFGSLLGLLRQNVRARTIDRDELYPGGKSALINVHSAGRDVLQPLDDQHLHHAACSPIRADRIPLPPRCILLASWTSHPARGGLCRAKERVAHRSLAHLPWQREIEAQLAGASNLRRHLDLAAAGEHHQALHQFGVFSGKRTRHRRTKSWPGERPAFRPPPSGPWRRLLVMSVWVSSFFTLVLAPAPAAGRNNP